MAQLKLHIHIDPIKLSREKLSDNWPFISALYKHLTQIHEEPQIVPKEEKPSFGYFPQMIAPSNNSTISPCANGKRSIDQVYPDNFFQGVARQPFFQV